MSTKKKANNRPKVRRTAGKKVMPMKKLAKKKGAKKRLSKKKAAPKKAVVKTKAVGKKTAGPLKKHVQEKSQSVDTVAFPPERQGLRSGSQSADLQGLSNVEGADSESVDELIEEGNASEAGVVAGVEDAEDNDEREVGTHDVSQDDVPSEYLDKK